MLVLAADHVYKMDYSVMLDFHKKTNADCTIAVIDVPIKDANRFGIMITDAQDNIVDFEEKPEEPRSTLASMGVYIFTWRTLKKFLNEDEENPESSHDFGKDIIPTMLREGKKMVAYRFDGYWKDVGTEESLWQANMDLLDDLHLGFENWHILSRTEGLPPHYIAPTGNIKRCLITEGCEIYGSVENSILSNGIIVEEGAVVKDCVIMNNVRIGKNSVVNYAILDENTIIGENVVAGRPLEDGVSLTVFARDSVINSNSYGNAEHEG